LLRSTHFGADRTSWQPPGHVPYCAPRPTRDIGWAATAVRHCFQGPSGGSRSRERRERQHHPPLSGAPTPSHLGRAVNPLVSELPCTWHLVKHGAVTTRVCSGGSSAAA
jgi:hypothetical protein